MGSQVCQIESHLLALTGRDQGSAEASTKLAKAPISAERFVLPVEAAVFEKDPIARAMLAQGSG